MKCKITKHKQKIRNGKIINGFKVVGIDGRDKYIWKTTSKREAQRFCRVMKK